MFSRAPFHGKRHLTNSFGVFVLVFLGWEKGLSTGGLLHGGSFDFGHLQSLIDFFRGAVPSLHRTWLFEAGAGIGTLYIVFRLLRAEAPLVRLTPTKKYL